ncbi:hypothetical protein VTL71DRAFT_13574 [Oculimacula yallundae]|uniref:2EXR domain-containing protein n=1 Tax=Oculimacula yallundae TaxID=86028 RepID=A0ABR4CKR8_9HELO
MPPLVRSKLRYCSNYESDTSDRSSPPVAVPDRTFTCFLKLPIEIRFMIWKLIAPGPRLIRRTCLGNPNSDEDNITRVPRVLHISPDSRALMMKTYTLEVDLRQQLHSCALPSGSIYVNWKLDILCPMPADHYINIRRTRVLNDPRIRNIALNPRKLLSNNSTLRKDGCLDIPNLLGMSNLKQVTFYFIDHWCWQADCAAQDSMKLEELDESLLIKHRCRMPKVQHRHLSYLMAAKKAVSKDYDILSEGVKKNVALRERAENDSEELIVKHMEHDDKWLESSQPRPVVKFARLTTTGKCPNQRDGDRASTVLTEWAEWNGWGEWANTIPVEKSVSNDNQTSVEPVSSISF